MPDDCIKIDSFRVCLIDIVVFIWTFRPLSPPAFLLLDFHFLQRLERQDKGKKNDNGSMIIKTTRLLNSETQEEGRSIVIKTTVSWKVGRRDQFLAQLCSFGIDDQLQKFKEFYQTGCAR